MFRGRRVVQDETVAGYMRTFFRDAAFGPSKRDHPSSLARSYGRHLWRELRRDQYPSLRRTSAPFRSRFNISLATSGAGAVGFEQLTKRVSLVSDTLLLSHGHSGPFHELGETSVSTPTIDVYSPSVLVDAPDGPTQRYGMYCPDLGELGRWIHSFTPLLKAGLAWYVPTYSMTYGDGYFSTKNDVEPIASLDWLTIIDFLVEDGRAVDASGEQPIKSQLVRPILEIDLPFVEGVDARTFSKVTIDEFASYSAFRDFLRRRLLDMDDSLNAVQSEREIVKVGLDIKDQIRAAGAEMAKAKRKRALAASGAVVGSVGASLVAVYGPALAAVVAALGAGSGVWGMLNAAADTTPRAIREDTWYYVWVLQKKSTWR